MNLHIQGQLKNYAGLLTALGILDDTVIDDRYRGFLKKAGSDATGDITAAAGKEIILANYNGLEKTFDTVWLIDKPMDTLAGQTPVPSGLQVSEFPRGEETRYSNNMHLRMVDSFVCTDCDETIFCGSCGFQIQKDTLYDIAPEFTWGELFDGGDTADVRKMVKPADPFLDPALATAIITDINVAKDGMIWCPHHRGYGKFETIADSINDVVGVPVLDIPNPNLLVEVKDTIDHVLDMSAPGPILDFAATDDQIGKVTFTWSLGHYGYPSPTYDLYQAGALLESGIGLGHTIDFVGVDDFNVQAINTTTDAMGIETINTSDSNVDSGEGLPIV